MSPEEQLANLTPETRPVIDCLRGCADLADLDAATLGVLEQSAVRFSLPAGHLLFEAGSAAEGVYLLLSGRLRVRTLWNGGPEAEIAAGELVGEAGWLLRESHGNSVEALRDSELLLLPSAALVRVTAASGDLHAAIARLCARRLQRSNQPVRARERARVFVIVPNTNEVDVADVATRLTAALTKIGSTDLMWDARATTHTAAWFHAIEEANDFVVYVADATESGWTRQCCRQADVILLAACAASPCTPWPPWPQSIVSAATTRGARIELALLHDGTVTTGAAARWLAAIPRMQHHHLVDDGDYARVARLLSRRGVGLVLSGGGARGFAHLGVIRALREAGVPIDFIGGSSIGSIIAAGVAMGWSDDEMRMRYHRGFVETNPVNDYTVPVIALTRGRKVKRLLEREYGATLIEDLRRPFFCISTDLKSGQIFEHNQGSVAHALRASVAIPGVMPPVSHGDMVLVDGATINNFPVDVMQRHAPGMVIGSDVSADLFPGNHRRLHIFQILMYAGLVNGAANAAAQRKLADVLLKPPLKNIDLLHWRAFDRAIEAGYCYASRMIRESTELPRVAAAPAVKRGPSSLEMELKRRMAATSPI
jgi:NTE family protein